MPRKVGSETKKNVWNVTINIEDNEIHNKEYPTLKLASADLGLTYAQMYELGPKGRKKKDKNNFKYTPNVVVEKIGAINEPEPVTEPEPVLLGDFETEI